MSRDLSRYPVVSQMSESVIVRGVSYGIAILR